LAYLSLDHPKEAEHALRRPPLFRHKTRKC
jgi:hypothetical protein